MTTPLDDRFLGRELVKAAVQRQIFSPYGGEVLDMRRAVLLDGTDHGGTMHIMTGDEFDAIEGPFFERFSRDDYDVYDGRVLFGKK
jgi:hypothetical protein